jgi:hypothetical protein
MNVPSSSSLSSLAAQPFGADRGQFVRDDAERRGLGPGLSQQRPAIGPFSAQPATVEGLVTERKRIDP